MDAVNELQEKIPEECRIPRLVKPTSREFFEEYYLKEQPVIIEGALAGWACQRRWTLPYLIEAIGSKKHTFRYENGASIAMLAADYLRAAFPGHGEHGSAFPALPSATERLPYMRHFGPLTGALAADYPIGSLFPGPGAVKLVSYLFCGVPTTKTNCHYDWSHNFVGIVRGQKHVTLLPPGSERFMNLPAEVRQKMAQGNCDFFADPVGLHLRLETWAPGEGKLLMHEHPVLRDCPGVYYSPLHEGDLVFFPANWYHYFHNIDSSLSVTTQTALL